MGQINTFPLSVELAKANSLLRHSESEVPEFVLRVIQFCCEREIGFILSRNIKVLSCKDARSNRFRL